jgi:HTH-type transcriptional repressor of NAD biosynthesis genes
MVKAFVFGKFLPFHKGHEAMIRFAITKCDCLSVLICCSDRETVPGDTRKKWISETFLNRPNPDIQVFKYKESEYPNTSVSSQDVSRVWAIKFKELFPEHSLLITSEPYGTFVAEYMNIKHLSFDMERTAYPVSSSLISGNLSANWHFLPDSVKPSYALKVVILGTESTGKTILTKKLAQYYNCSYVHEAGRELIPNSKSFEYNDLYIVANEHAKNIRKAILKNHLTIIDTDIHITKSYANFVFNKDLPVNDEICDANKSQLYLYLNNDVAFIQDGTRLDEQERNLLDISHRRTLANHRIPFVEITGNWQQRFEQAVTVIDNQFFDVP